MSRTSQSRRNLLIRASAGTGKTFQLTNRYLELVAAGQPPDTILATTFTRKGAGEILDRVLYRLAAAAREAHELDQLARHVAGPPWTPARCRDLLALLVRSLPRLRVGTLDGFFIQVARSFGLELGLPPGWQIADEILDSRLRREAVQMVLQEESTSHTVRLMNLLSKGEANQSVSQQIESLVEDLYDIYLESPAEAWRSLPRPSPLEPAALSEALDALAAAPVANGKSMAKARDHDLEKARAGDWSGWITAGVAKKVARGDARFGRQAIPPALQAAYEPLVQHARAVLVGRIANQTEATYRLLERFDAAYQRLKRSRLAMRFEDITRRLAESRLVERTAEVMYRIDAGITHLLLDEFQDTNLSQWQIVRPLARRTVEPGSGRSFFCVGDGKQAIFGWRGGVAEIFDTLEEELDGLQTEPLNKSYRSAQPVIDTVNRVFDGLADNDAVQNYASAAARWAARFQTHSTHYTDRPGYGQLVTAPQAAETETASDATLRFAAEQVARLHRQAPGRTIGVLVRKNSSVAQIIWELRHRQIDASEEGGVPLADSPAVGLLLSLLRLADHPGDTAARFHLAHSPLGPPLGLAGHQDPAAALQLARQTRHRLIHEGYGPTLWQWAQTLRPHVDLRDQDRLMQLVELAYSYDPAATLRADDFVRLVSEKRVEDPTAAGVRVMTLHKAKGLQFDIVVLPELDVALRGQPPGVVLGRPRPTAPVAHVCRYVSQQEQALLPPSFQAMFQRHRDQQVEEALCVLYVGLTRPRHALHMIIAPSSPRERNLPATMAGLLRAALTDKRPAEPETVLYQHGDPQWHRRLEATAAPPRKPPPAAARPWKLAPAPAQTARRLEFQSPSQLEGGYRVNLASCMNLDAAEARNRGTLLHAWFEQIRWLDDGPPEPEQLRQVAASVKTTGLDVAALLSQFQECLEKPPVAQLLRRASYETGRRIPARTPAPPAKPQWEVLREYPFVVRDGQTVWSGQIDRLVLLHDGPTACGAEIIDFKTDSFSADDPEALAERVDHYRPQLAAYRKAVAKTFHLPPDRIATTLAFVVPGIVTQA